MAWRAFLAETVTKSNTLDLEMVVQYYDDADPANAGVGPGPPVKPPAVILHGKVFLIDHNWKQAEVLDLIRAEGQQARAAINTAAAINSQFPKGSTLAIP